MLLWKNTTMRESEGQENMIRISCPLASRNYFFFAGFFGAAFAGTAFFGAGFFGAAFAGAAFAGAAFFGAAFAGAAFFGAAFAGAAFAGAAFFGAGFFGAACAIMPSFWSWVSIPSSLLYFLSFHIKKIVSLLDNR
jgi:uncharacterized protein YjbI with pentapeptide repeats